MSKKAKIISFNDIDSIKIIFGNGKPLDEVKGDADFIMNGGYYTMATNKPVCHLKVDGKVYAEPPADNYWNDWGYTWNTNDILLTVIPANSKANHITATKLIAGSLGPTDKLTYNSSVAGSRPRTAMALTKDSLILYCSDDGMTPEELRDDLVSMGAVSAIMLDGGGSSQCDFQGDKIKSTRRVNNYIAVWLTEEAKKGKKMKVVLDPGHGIETAGKRAPDESYFEYTGNMAAALKVMAHLERHGVEVVLTRNDEHDVSLADRANISNAEKPDLFVSIHSNGAGNGVDWADVRGFGVYTSKADDNADRNKAAKAIIARAEEAGIHLWGDGLHHEMWTVLAKTNAPAVLIEMLFHDNKEDVALLKDPEFQAKMAEAIVKGILDYLGIAWVSEVEEGCKCPWCGKLIKLLKG